LDKVWIYTKRIKHSIKKLEINYSTSQRKQYSSGTAHSDILLLTAAGSAGIIIMESFVALYSQVESLHITSPDFTTSPDLKTFTVLKFFPVGTMTQCTRISLFCR